MVELAASIIGGAALAALFGAMVFFPSVVAPTVFKVLDPEPAGRFLRAVFPGYYLFLIITSALAAAAHYAKPLFALGLSLVALSTVGVRYWLVPRINAWRDADLAGDQAARRKFALGHRISVTINLIQMLVVIAILVATLTG